MGFWAGIKRALNSTLGTSSFKPLNVMIDEAKTAILSEIDGQRSLAASDSVIQVVFSGSENVSNTYESIGEFIPRKNGSVRALVEYYNKSSSLRTFTLQIRRVEDGVVVGTTSLEANGTQANNVFVDVPVVANINYEVVCYATSAVSVTSVKIGAQIVDTSLVEV